MLADPRTGKIPAGIRDAELREAATIPLEEEAMPFKGNTYSFVVSSNIGGHCRALANDVRFNSTANRVMLAGGVSGRMFRCTEMPVAG